MLNLSAEIPVVCGAECSDAPVIGPDQSTCRTSETPVRRYRGEKLEERKNSVAGTGSAAGQVLKKTGKQIS